MNPDGKTVAAPDAAGKLRARLAGLRGVWGVLALMLLATVVLALTKPAPRPPVAVVERAVPVRVATVTEQPVVDVRLLPGRVESCAAVDVGAPKGGCVTAVLVAEGERVEAGQLLVQIEDGAWQAARRRAEVALDEARRESDRVKALHTDGALSDRERDRAQAQAAVAEAGLEEASLYVAQCAVRAPTNGVLDTRCVEVGEFAAEGAVVGRVVYMDEVDVVFHVPEHDILAARTGAALAFTLQVYPGEVFTGTVSYVSVAADRERSAYRVRLRTANPGWRLKPGMIAEVSLPRGEGQHGMLLPLAAVVPDRGEHVVFLARDGHAVRRIVRIDRILTEQAVIAAGLAVGEQVIIEGQRGLQDGMPVTVSAPAAAGPDAP